MPERRVVLVTGASSGIGQSIARRLAQSGFTVFGTSRNPAQVEPTPGVEVLPLDVRSDPSASTCVDAVRARAGRLDTLINNAGYVLTGAIEDASVDEARDQFETNFFGTVRMVKAVLPRMREERSGQIINISSLAGLVPAPPFCGMYSASKHALEAYTDHLWRELAPFQVRVSLVEPGSIRTNLTRNQQDPRERIAAYDPSRRRASAGMRRLEDRGPAPDLVADRVLQIIKSPSPRLRYRVGADATWVPRLHRLLPRGLFELGLRRTFRMDVDG
jgi:NAD(P)-dependent dehydrogenase (short-subunit alcohol dehydrogenase family)